MTKYAKERNWTFIIYPDSLPENWQEIITQMHVKMVVSPLHDKDINPTGEKKKPHYHAMIMFDGPITYIKAESISKELNGTIPMRVLNAGSMVRYFTHKDNPEKAQYDEREIKTWGGLDLQDLNALSESQIDELIRGILQLIKAEGIMEYSKLIDYLNINDFRDMLRVARKNTIFFNSYLKSKKGVVYEANLM